MKIQFNTGRIYSEHGQRIVAETVEGGVIFRDIDRGISGLVPTVPGVAQGTDEAYNACVLKGLIIANYDAGNYTWHPEAGRLEWDSNVGKGA